MKILTLASRNIFRNWQRSLVTTAAMAFGCGIMIIYSTLISGLLEGAERQAVVMSTADIQIHAQGYRDDPDLYNTIVNTDLVLANIPEEKYHAASRRYAYGLVASESNSSGVQLRGLDLISEPKVTKIHQQIMTGDWLSQDEPYGVVIGKKLARVLGVDIGDELIFLGSSADGSMANEILRVRGVLKTISSSIDSSGVFIRDSVLIEMLVLSDNAHEIAVIRKDKNVDLDAAREEISIIAGSNETLDWRELMPVIARFLETSQSQTFIMLLFTYIAVASVILNAMLMSVFERIHEFGVMKALGVTPIQSFLLVYSETIIQTVVACILGLIMGWFSSRYLEIHGIDMSSLAGSINFGGVALDPVWRASINQADLFNPVIFLFAIALIAVLYPAIKVARIKALDAIHHQ